MKNMTNLCVIIPVLDNGFSLFDRAIQSLKRCPEFSEMEIIIIDQGSTKPETIHILRKLEKRNKNIIVQWKNSRKREFPDSEYVTLLRPEQEINDLSYSYILKELSINTGIELIFGYTSIYTGRERIKRGKYYSKDKIIKNPEKFLQKEKFNTPLFEASMVSRALLEKLSHNWLEELSVNNFSIMSKILLESSKSKYVNKEVLFKYDVLAKYPEKFFINEKDVHKDFISMLKKRGLYEDFISNLAPIEIRDIYWKDTAISNSLDNNQEMFIREILSLYDCDLREKYSNYIEEIPESNGSQYYKKFNLNVGIITDLLAYNYFKDVSNLTYISQSNYKKIIDEGRLDVLFFVTCWYGMDNNDLLGITNNPAIKEKVFEIFSYAKKNNVPIVYWSKEDPPHYESFVDYAKKADYIFTTAIECVEKYKKDTGNHNVYVLKYGINPLIHNPLGSRIRDLKNFKTKDSALFAGTWYPHFPERIADQYRIFDGIVSSSRELLILDRNFFNNVLNYDYPSKYKLNTYPSIEYQQLQKFHKLFDWAVNFNIVKESQTMCAARVYELQALGVSIISNESLAIQNMFPNIFVPKSTEDLSKIFSYSAIEIYQNQMEGVRQVYSGNTVFDRFEEILVKIRIKDSFSGDKPVYVICEEITPKVLAMFNKQQYKNKYLITSDEVMITNRDSYIAFFGEDYEYGRHYLEDMVNAYKYTDVYYVTKDSKIEHNYVYQVEDKYKTLFSLEKLQLKEILNKKQFNYLGYSIDRFELKEIKEDKK
jgi:hypothetical protein